MTILEYNRQNFPPDMSFDTPEILKALNKTTRLLAEVKGRAQSIPKQEILINTLALQEANASSEIESIITTQDELFQNHTLPEEKRDPASKEVLRYREALSHGFHAMQEQGGLSNNTLIAMFQILKEHGGSYRTTPGTVLKNERDQSVVYTPPQDHAEIKRLMHDLETFINDDADDDLDPLIKMALIHHQFESIHPFPDGNGRIGRIINVLYLVHSGLLDIPILYLSRDIIRHKDEYYRLLNTVREQGTWHEWVLYMLKAVENTSAHTLKLILGISDQMAFFKQTMRKQLPDMYSHDLLNLFFNHPYTRIDTLTQNFSISRQTASKYLGRLNDCGLLAKIRKGRNHYYINTKLVKLLAE